DAEVEQRRTPVALDEQVAAVQVAVEDATEHGALAKCDQAGAQERARVDPGLVHRLDVVEREAPEPLHHEDSAGHEGGVGPGAGDPAPAGRRDDAPDVSPLLPLPPQL